MSTHATTTQEIPTNHPDFCQCQRPNCGAWWLKRVQGRPKRCPTCNSPVWDKAPKFRRPDRTGEFQSTPPESGESTPIGYRKRGEKS